MYLSAQRREYILRLLAERGSIRSTAIAREIGVTDETIRTDLIALEKQGQLQRTHGGAIYRIPSNASTTPASQVLLPLVPLLKREKLIYIQDSSLTQLLLKLIEDIPLQLLSNSPSLLQQLRDPAQRHQVSSIGGTLDKQSGQFLGAVAEHCLKLMPPSSCILTPEHVTPTHKGYLILHYPSIRAARWAELVRSHAQRCFIVGRASMLTPPDGNLVSSAPLSIDKVFSEGNTVPPAWSSKKIPYALASRLSLTPLISAPDSGQGEF